MKKNRRRSERMSVAAFHSAHIGAVILTLVVMAVVNILAKASCTELMTDIGRNEKKLERLEDERQRESSAWTRMSSPSQLEAMLARHGLAMRLPKPQQNIRMNADGTPKPAQLALAKVQSRVTSTAMNTPPPRLAPNPRRRR